MYGVPAALAIADAVGSGRTSRLTSIRDPSVVVAAMVVRCQRPSLVRSVAHLWLIPCAARRVRMTLTPYSASTAMNRWPSIRLLSWCQTGRNPSSDLSDWNAASSSAIPDIFFLFIIMKLYLFFKYLFRAIFSPKICLPSGKTISSGKNDAEFVPQTSIDAGNA